MPLQTADTIQTTGAVAGFIAPTIYIPFSVDADGNAVITLGYRSGITSATSTGFEYAEEIRPTAAQLVAFDAGYTAAFEALRDIMEEYAKDYLETLNGSATITII